MYAFARIICLVICAFAYNAHANIIDSSANKPAFPPAGLTLLATVTNTSARQAITVQNQSAATIQVWRDQNCSGVQMSVILLAPNAAAAQGAAWSSDTFKGCARIYGAVGAQIAIYQD